MTPCIFIPSCGAARRAPGRGRHRCRSRPCPRTSSIGVRPGRFPRVPTVLALDGDTVTTAEEAGEPQCSVRRLDGRVWVEPRPVTQVFLNGRQVDDKIGLVGGRPPGIPRARGAGPGHQPRQLTWPEEENSTSSACPSWTSCPAVSAPIVLFFMIINHGTVAKSEEVNKVLLAEVSLLEEEVLQGDERLVLARNSLGNDADGYRNHRGPVAAAHARPARSARGTGTSTKTAASPGEKTSTRLRPISGVWKRRAAGWKAQ